MTAPSAPRDPARPRRVAIVDIISDSFGREVIPPNARLVGSENILSERIVDSKTRKAALELLNDAARALGTLESIRAREDLVKAREDAIAAHEEFFTRTMLTHAISKLDAPATRMDAVEQERAKDPDDDELPPPPSFGGDDGDLEVPKTASSEDLPRSPVAVED